MWFGDGYVGLWNVFVGEFFEIGGLLIGVVLMGECGCYFVRC